MSRRLFAACLAGGVAALLSATSLAQTHQPPPLVIDSMAGRDLFEFYCATCHGEDARGKGPVGVALKTPPADLTRIAERRGGAFPRAELVRFVSDGPALIPAHGTIDMPVWGPIFRGLDSSDTRARIRIDNLVSYLESMQTKQTPQPDGQALFFTYCASCHGADARGGGPLADMLRTRPSNLTQFAVKNGGVFPAERLYRIIDGKDQSVRGHGSFEMPVWGDAFRQREGLSDERVRARIEAIVRFLSTIQERLAH
jgi:mono/diheme cytochrome c family protein